MSMIIANWKSNKSTVGVEEWFDGLKTMIISSHEDVAKNLPQDSGQINLNSEIVVAPSFCHLGTASKKIEEMGKVESLALATQDLSQFSAGSYTGAISGVNLQGFHVKYCIVGHSERRRYFGETITDVAMKVDQALNNNLIPIVCVDEDYIESQANSIEKSYLDKCIVAYEPLSAIGSGNNQSVGKVKEVVEKIKNFFGKVTVVYGGSVNDLNVREYLLVCDGVLVGSASLDVESFWRIVKNSR